MAALEAVHREKSLNLNFFDSDSVARGIVLFATTNLKRVIRRSHGGVLLSEESRKFP
jgi:hypothetical protein